MSNTHKTQHLFAYSAMEEYELKDYVAGIEAAHPDMRIQVERMSTAALHMHLLTQGVNSHWDLILGWALTALLDPPILTLLAPLESTKLRQDITHDTSNLWCSPSAFVPAFCINHTRLSALGLPMPRSWRDLTNPCYAHEIVIPNPAMSGAGFLHLSALLQLSGEKSAWQTLAKVAANMPSIVSSAFAPCLAVTRNTAAIGVTVSTAVKRLINNGVDVSMIVPTDASRFEPEVFAINAFSKKKEAASRAIEWMTTASACALYQSYGKLVLVNSDTSGMHAPTLPCNPIDPLRAIASRNAACTRWQSLFLASPGKESTGK